MNSSRLVARLATAVAFAVLLLPACDREPEEQPQVAPEPQEVDEPQQVVALPLPQSNPEIGITLNSVPTGMVVRTNTGYWIALVETSRPSVTYTFVADTQKAHGVPIASIEAFESNLLSYEGAQIVGNGTVDTALGDARWTGGRYSEDGEAIEVIYLIASHPTGEGKLILTSTCSPGAMPLEDRLQRIVDLAADADAE